MKIFPLTSSNAGGSQLCLRKLTRKSTFSYCLCLLIFPANMSKGEICEDLPWQPIDGVSYTRHNHTHYSYECRNSYYKPLDIKSKGEIVCNDEQERLRFTDLDGNRMSQPECIFDATIGKSNCCV